METVLVTGATGFAGRYLIQELIRRRYQIVGTYYRTGPRRTVFTDPVRWLHCDARSRSQTRQIVAEVKPRYIIHLAAASTPSLANADPRFTTETNVLGWVNLMEAVHALRDPCRALLISTYHVYGATEAGPAGHREDDLATPLDVYTASRLMGEMVARDAARRGDLDVVIARVGNHVGPGQSTRYFVSSIAEQIARIEAGLIPARLDVGNVDLVRDISDVRDIVRAYVDLLLLGQSGDVYNVCSGRRVSLRDVIGLLASMSDVAFDVHTDPQRVRRNDPVSVQADRSKLTRDAGWEPRYELSTTLRDVLAWHRGRLRDSLRSADSIVHPIKSDRLVESCFESV